MFFPLSQEQSRRPEASPRTSREVLHDTRRQPECPGGYLNLHQAVSNGYVSLLG
jgi:hypothetical protein